MDDYISDIRDRQDKFEGRMTHLEATVTEEAGLRAEMDTNLDEVATKLEKDRILFNALQETQGDHSNRLTRIEDKVTGIAGRLDGVETRLDRVETRLDGVEIRLDGVEGHLVTVKAGVHAILDLLDTHLAKKSLASRLAGRFTRRRDSSIFEI
jgi:chromosome segregation ATPase